MIYPDPGPDPIDSYSIENETITNLRRDNKELRRKWHEARKNLRIANKAVQFYSLYCRTLIGDNLAKREEIKQLHGIIKYHENL
jgi:hypothetical protein